MNEEHPDLIALFFLFLITVAACIILVNFIQGQTVNETAWPVFNKKHLDAGQFLVEAGQKIQDKAEYNNWEIYDIKIRGNRTLGGKWEIHTIWVYYKEKTRADK